MDGFGPGHSELGAKGDCRRRRDGLLGHFGFRFRLGFRRCLNDRLNLSHGVAQLVGILRWHKSSAGIFGNTGKLPLVFAGNVKADDMSCEGNALLLELGGDRTGIGLTGLDAVRDQYDRGRIIPKRKGFGRLDHRVGQGCFTPWCDAIDRRQERICIDRLRRDHQFDITAVAFAPVTIGHKPQIGRLRPCSNQVGHDLAGSLDFGDAIDLPPHRV